MTTPSSFVNRTTPGVYITETDAFPAGIVGVQTGLPAFIGYTEYAGDPRTGKPLYNTPVRVSSLVEYSNFFGGPAQQRFAVSVAPTHLPADFSAKVNTDSAGPSAVAPSETRGFCLTPASANFNLYRQMQLYFANGGGDCFIVSVGSYWGGQSPVAAPPFPLPGDWDFGTIESGDTSSTDKPGLLVGLQAAGREVGPTMIVIPEACQLPEADYAQVACAMMLQASSLGDRVAILDLPGVLGATTIDALQAAQAALSTAIAPQIASASYAATYAPAVNASVISPSDLLYTCLQTDDNSVINNLLTSQAYALYPAATFATIQSAIAAAFPLPAKVAKPNTAQYSGDATAYAPPTDTSELLMGRWRKSLDDLLVNWLPILSQIKQQVANILNIAPPSGIMAGIWAMNDGQKGVWNAPANTSLAMVAGPTCQISDTEQASFNVPTNGQAINILRAQPGRGAVVWGARTLDGNSQDLRYIQVRRALIYCEQSIKVGLQAYVFAANDASIWSTITASISSFLTGFWRQGGLMGASSGDAFSVRCGLGTTMTSEDVLNGILIVQVTLAITHPAEFIALTFRQQMQS